MDVLEAIDQRIYDIAELAAKELDVEDLDEADKRLKKASEILNKLDMLRKFVAQGGDANNTW
ncbi:hypothetical protein [Ferruginibacter sp.]|uniref:hypothetical protein n=1 Tax=Ferruginibacter sp. TaxID=1940288 RepID=UPI002657B498|nr:hypothetical protein [Ferruginibacter sp.]